MRNIYKFFSILLLCALVACGDDNDAPAPVQNNNPPDTEKPKIQLLTPEANKAYLIIDWVQTHAKLSDNVGLKSIRILLAAADGNKREVIEQVTISHNTRFLEFGSSFFPRDKDMGTYTLVLEVKDMQNNMATDSVVIRVHAPDINRSEFSRVFKENSFYYNIDWGWFGLDFTNGVQFNEEQFSIGMYLMVNIDSYIAEDEWEKFVQDFNFKKQSWAKWDEDKNGELDGIEFHNGLVRLNLFQKWDVNNDRLVKGDELIAGIFKQWDQNQNDVLTRAEYYDKYYKYLLLF